MAAPGEPHAPARRAHLAGPGDRGSAASGRSAARARAAVRPAGRGTPAGDRPLAPRLSLAVVRQGGRPAAGAAPAPRETGERAAAATLSRHHPHRVRGRWQGAPGGLQRRRLPRAPRRRVHAREPGDVQVPISPGGVWSAARRTGRVPARFSDAVRPAGLPAAGEGSTAQSVRRVWPLQPGVLARCAGRRATAFGPYGAVPVPRGRPDGSLQPVPEGGRSLQDLHRPSRTGTVLFPSGGVSGGWILRGRDAARREPADAVGRRRPPRVLPGWSPGSDPALSRAAGRSFPPARDGGRGEGVLRSVPAPGSTVGLLSDDPPGRARGRGKGQQPVTSYTIVP